MNSCNTPFTIWHGQSPGVTTEGKALFVVGSGGGGNVFVFVFVSPVLSHPSMKKEKKGKKNTPTCTNSHRPNQTQCPGYRPIFQIYVMLFPTTEVQGGNSVCTLYGRNCRWEHEALCSTLHPATELQFGPRLETTSQPGEKTSCLHIDPANDQWENCKTCPMQTLLYPWSSWCSTGDWEWRNPENYRDCGWWSGEQFCRKGFGGSGRH